MTFALQGLCTSGEVIAFIVHWCLLFFLGTFTMQILWELAGRELATQNHYAVAQNMRSPNSSHLNGSISHGTTLQCRGVTVVCSVGCHCFLISSADANGLLMYWSCGLRNAGIMNDIHCPWAKATTTCLDTDWKYLCSLWQWLKHIHTEAYLARNGLFTLKL